MLLLARAGGVQHEGGSAQSAGWNPQAEEGLLGQGGSRSHSGALPGALFLQLREMFYQL